MVAGGYLALVTDSLVAEESKDEFNRRHNDFTNNPLGTSWFEVLILTTINQLSNFLVVILLSSFTILIKKEFLYVRLCVEAIALFVPFILSVTSLNSGYYLFPVALIVISIVILLQRRQITSPLNWTEILYINRPVEQKINSVTNLFGNLLVSVFVTILAVDFPSFPRKLAKTESYGWSLMDAGIGCFIAVNAAFSPEARFLQMRGSINKLYSLKKSLVSAIPIFILGLARLVSVKLFNYHSPVTEYGVHWNFFFTLAITKLISNLLFCFGPLMLRPGHIAVWMMVFHQIALSFGLNQFIQDQSGDRSTFLQANKEGLISLLGNIALFLFFVEIGNYWFTKRNTGKNRDLLFIFIESMSVSIIAAMVMFFSHFFIEEISRKEANLAYICWMISFIMFLIALEASLSVVTVLFQHFGLLESSARFRSLIFSGITSNGLLLFLVANILTGLINITIDTTKVTNDFVSFVIIGLYSGTVATVAVLLFNKNKKYRLPNRIVHKVEILLMYLKKKLAKKQVTFIIKN